LPPSTYGHSIVAALHIKDGQKSRKHDGPIANFDSGYHPHIGRLVVAGHIRREKHDNQQGFIGMDVLSVDCVGRAIIKQKKANNMLSL
jgi:hypothetical protein